MRLETRFCLIILVNVRKRHNIIDTCIPLQLCGCILLLLCGINVYEPGVRYSYYIRWVNEGNVHIPKLIELPANRPW